MIVAIWIVSGIALVALLVFAAVRFVRGVIRILLNFSDLASTTAQLDRVQATRELERPVPAVLEPWRVVKNRFDERMSRRASRIGERRAARRARARALTTADLRDLPALPVRRG